MARPPEKSLLGLAAALGRATGGVVDDHDVAWEESPGFWTETFVGRHLLFLSRPKADEPRDLYRARVRVTLDGQIIEVRGVKNLTDTPQGDDVGLETKGERASFATLAYGKIQGISVLELPGIRRSDRPESLFDRMLVAINSLQETGSLSGIGRTDIVLDAPADHARLSLEAEKLTVDFGEPGRGLSFDVASRKLSAAAGGEVGARAVPQKYGGKPFVHWLVDTVRAEVGPEPVAWVENKVFGAQDDVKRVAYSLFASKAGNELKAGSDKGVVARVLDASAFAGRGRQLAAAQHPLNLERLAAERRRVEAGDLRLFEADAGAASRRRKAARVFLSYEHSPRREAPLLRGAADRARHAAARARHAGWLRGSEADDRTARRWTPAG